MVSIFPQTKSNRVPTASVRHIELFRDDFSIKKLDRLRENVRSIDRPPNCRVLDLEKEKEIVFVPKRKSEWTFSPLSTRLATELVSTMG